MLVGVFLAGLAAGGGLFGEDPAREPGDPGFEPFLVLRSGVWASRGFQFDSTKDSIRRQIDTNALFSAGVDAGLKFLDHFVLFGSYEVNLAEDLFSDLAGACVGYRERGSEGADPSVPIETTVYVGGLWGRFEVDAPGYAFEDAWGFRAGIAFSWRAGRSLTVDLLGEYRLIEFDCEVPPDSGDDRVGGSTGWLGLGLQYRF